MAASQFSKILVEGYQHAVFALRPSQDPFIRKPRLIITNPCNVQPAFTQHTNSWAGHVFIGQVTHHLGRDWIVAHVPEGFGHVCITSL